MTDNGVSFRQRGVIKFLVKRRFLLLIFTTDFNMCMEVCAWVLVVLDACFAFRISTSLLPDEALKTIYFAYVHSILTYGIILWDCIRGKLYPCYKNIQNAKKNYMHRDQV